MLADSDPATQVNSDPLRIKEEPFSQKVIKVNFVYIFYTHEIEIQIVRLDPDLDKHLEWVSGPSSSLNAVPDLQP